ncbi:hypothetical protein BZG36_00076 [Bifiguratus adelaidae]|uniref:SUN domain-containing protein n=1 Tax=Bifiguratus adelaidae TaxID=1938954 RepID=A0A261Y8L3_9FUNG|nr:hypothetical protein BZG36_00076 [Bifiguratus adelaidae]
MRREWNPRNKIGRPSIDTDTYRGRAPQRVFGIATAPSSAISYAYGSASLSDNKNKYAKQRDEKVHTTLQDYTKQEPVKEERNPVFLTTLKAEEEHKVDRTPKSHTLFTRPRPDDDTLSETQVQQLAVTGPIIQVSEERNSMSAQEPVMDHSNQSVEQPEEESVSTPEIQLQRVQDTSPTPQQARTLFQELSKHAKPVSPIQLLRRSGLMEQRADERIVEDVQEKTTEKDRHRHARAFLSQSEREKNEEDSGKNERKAKEEPEETSPSVREIKRRLESMYSSGPRRAEVPRNIRHRTLEDVQSTRPATASVPQHRMPTNVVIDTSTDDLPEPLLASTPTEDRRRDSLFAPSEVSRDDAYYADISMEIATTQPYTLRWVGLNVLFGIFLLYWIPKRCIVWCYESGYQALEGSLIGAVSDFKKLLDDNFKNSQRAQPTASPRSSSAPPSAPSLLPHIAFLVLLFALVISVRQALSSVTSSDYGIRIPPSISQASKFSVVNSLRTMWEEHTQPVKTSTNNHEEIGIDTTLVQRLLQAESNFLEVERLILQAKSSNDARERDVTQHQHILQEAEKQLRKLFAIMHETSDDLEKVNEEDLGMLRRQVEHVSSALTTIDEHLDELRSQVEHQVSTEWAQKALTAERDLQDVRTRLSTFKEEVSQGLTATLDKLVQPMVEEVLAEHLLLVRDPVTGKASIDAAVEKLLLSEFASSDNVDHKLSTWSDSKKAMLSQKAQSITPEGFLTSLKDIEHKVLQSLSLPNWRDVESHLDRQLKDQNHISKALENSNIATKAQVRQALREQLSVVKSDVRAHLQDLSARIGLGTEQSIREAKQRLALAKHVHDTMASVLEQYCSDEIGMQDFALASAGARVVSDITSPIPADEGIVDWITRRWRSKQLWDSDPYQALTPTTQRGDCWNTYSKYAQLGVRLVEPILISAISLEHIDWSIASERDRRMAPTEVEVWAQEWQELPDESLEILPPQLLAIVHYNYSGQQPTVQTFEIPSAKVNKVVRTVLFRFNGNVKETCVYRVRVHGKPLADTPEDCPNM